MSDPGNCDCSPCNDAIVQNIAGPKGDPGAAGAAGAKGVDAYTFLTASFVMPAVSGGVTISVLSSLWMGAGQNLFIENGGYFEVLSIPDATHANIVNLGYVGNVNPGTTVTNTSHVSPGGIAGTNGSAGTITFNQISPTNTKGDLIVDNGASNPLANDTVLKVGTDGQVLVSNSSQGAGLKWTTVLPNLGTDNAIVTLDNGGGVSVPLPLQERKLIITDDGAIQSTPTGGNARGSKAVDLQVDRAGNTQVASGANAVIAGGQSNTASAIYSSVGGGTANKASGGQSTVAGGQSNTASGSNSVVVGGQSNAATTNNSVVIGGATNQATGTGATCVGGEGNFSSGQYSTARGNGAVAFRYGEHGESAGSFANAGDAQASRLVMRGTTADAVATEIFLDGFVSRIALLDDSTVAFRMLISARRTDADNESAAYQLLGCIDRNSGAASVAIVGSVSKTVIAEDNAAWDVAADADTGNGSLRLKVTGEAAKNIAWVALVELTQVSG